ncbi:MAG: DUF3330 domain-containing protein [Gammaproteobacteria bacterium]|jgi:YHS domain-containing protein
MKKHLSTSPDRADPPEKTVSCEECKKEVPLSGAFSSEAQDYVLYFCGQECFNHWRKKAEQNIGEPGQPE